MFINAERFFAMTLLIATVGCSSTDGNGGTGGTGGSATGGTGGGDAAADVAADSAGDDANGEDAATEAQADAANDGMGDAAACLGDSTMGDAGVEGICDTLPMMAETCPGPGGEGMLAPAYHFCLNTALYLRPGVLEGLAACFGQISQASYCDQAAADSCVQSVFGQACPVDWDGGTSPCGEIASRCPASAGGIDESMCEAVLASYQDPTRGNVVQCFLDKTDPEAGTGSGDCATDFTFCYSVPY